MHGPSLTRRHGASRSAEFFIDALRYAQSHWCCGKPAQAILQLDKALMCDVDPYATNVTAITNLPRPYLALAWILGKAASQTCGYLGNPVRHFQHLASRMPAARSTIRIWRAWSCMHLAERFLPPPQAPRDGRQLAREGIWIPSLGASLHQLRRHGWHGEADEVLMAMEEDQVRCPCTSRKGCEGCA
ncbi:MAG: hypothetical protein ACO3RV_01190 [Luteolibacter sp.]